MNKIERDIAQSQAAHQRFFSRQAVGAAEAASMGTEELRDSFHLGNLFEPGRITLAYTHYDRMIVGGAVPSEAPSISARSGRLARSLFSKGASWSR